MSYFLAYALSNQTDWGLGPSLFTVAEVSTLGGDRPAPEEDASVVCAKLVPKQQMGNEVLWY